MRPIYATLRLLPLAAALALTGCQDEEPGLTDEEMAAASGVVDNAVMPKSGEYSTGVELVELDAPGKDDATIAAMRDAFAEGAAEPHLLCVTQDTTREEWLSEMNEAQCSLTRLTAEGNSFDGAMTCSSEDGLNGPVDIAGTVGEAGSDLTLTAKVPTGETEATVRFKVTTQSTGESCG